MEDDKVSVKYWNISMLNIRRGKVPGYYQDEAVNMGMVGWGTVKMNITKSKGLNILRPNN